MTIQIPVYVKYTISYEKSCDKGDKLTTYVYAASESEMNAVLYKAMEHDSISMAIKTGTALNTINKESRLLKAETYNGGSIENPEEALFFWYNRKYYIQDEAFKRFVLSAMEQLEEYEICSIIVKGL